jgi:hypothetical protein
MVLKWPSGEGRHRCTGGEHHFLSTPRTLNSNLIILQETLSADKSAAKNVEGKNPMFPHRAVETKAKFKTDELKRSPPMKGFSGIFVPGESRCTGRGRSA